MSKDNKNQINCNFNFDKLNFKKIKKELDVIPKIIRNHNKIGLRSCISASNIYNHKNICFANNSAKEINDRRHRNNNNNLELQNTTSLTKCKTIQISNDDDLNTLQNNNFNIIERTSFNNSNPNTIINNEDICFQLNLENKRHLDKMKSIYEKKYSELNSFYENKFFNLNKLLQKSISEFNSLYKNYIPIYEHNRIINELKKTNNDLLEKTKQNYEKLINDLTDIMKHKLKYKDLIHRLQLYTKYEIDIDEIEKKIVQKFNEKINEMNNKGNDYFKDYYLISQLDRDINYHKKIFEMNQLYNEKLTQIKLGQNNKLDNLIKYVNNLFDNNLYIINDKLHCNMKNKKENLKLSTNNIKNNINKENYENISCSDKSNNNSSSKEIDKLLNIPDSYENRLKPQVMEINIFNKK